MRHYKWGAQNADAVTTDGQTPPSDTLPNTTTALDDLSPDDTTTGIQYSENRGGPLYSARARLIALCFDDDASLLLDGYRFTCQISTSVQSGGGLNKDARLEVWAYNGATWTKVRQEALNQYDAFLTFTGALPGGTRKAGVVVDNSVVANNSGSTPNFQGAAASLTDFRVTTVVIPCPIPPPPRLDKRVHFVEGVGTITLLGNQ